MRAAIVYSAIAAITLAAPTAFQDNEASSTPGGEVQARDIAEHHHPDPVNGTFPGHGCFNQTHHNLTAHCGPPHNGTHPHLNQTESEPHNGTHHGQPGAHIARDAPGISLGPLSSNHTDPGLGPPHNGTGPGGPPHNGTGPSGPPHNGTGPGLPPHNGTGPGLPSPPNGTHVSLTATPTMTGVPEGPRGTELP